MRVFWGCLWAEKGRKEYCAVDLSDISSVDDDCKIEANISFGNLLLRIPKQFRISNSSNASFATVEFEGNCDPEPAGVIKLEANVSFGQIMVKYI